MWGGGGGGGVGGGVLGVYCFRGAEWSLSVELRLSFALE